MGVFASGAVALGASIGSFLNVCIARLPEDRSLWPRSACPRCGTQLRPLEIIPIVSWVIQRGRCRHCGGPISPRYPLIELLTALMGWLIYTRIFTDPSDLDVAHGVAWLVYFTFACLLIVAAYVDLRYRIIPDETSLYAIPVGLCGVGVLNMLGYEDTLALPILDALAGAITGAGLLGFVAVGALVLTRQEGIGFGDVKLMGMIGAFIGLLPGVWMVLLWGSLLGSLIGVLHRLITRRRAYLPFGPSLAFTALVWVLYGPELLELFFPGIAWSLS